MQKEEDNDRTPLSLKKNLKQFLRTTSHKPSKEFDNDEQNKINVQKDNK